MKKFSNGLSDAQLERFAILMEELGEAQQVIGKIIRHGLFSRHPSDNGTGLDNQDMLEKELGDVYFAIDMLARSKDLDNLEILEWRAVKAGKIKPYLHHQDGQGATTQGTPEGRGTE
jgi:NTP pyrophosphatase (non-canonical NTP hydrolase)